MRIWLYLLVFLAVPFGVSGHEVYVLESGTIAHALQSFSPNPFGAFYTNQFQFFLWGFIAFVVVTTVFFASVTHRLERLFDPFLLKLKPYAPFVARVTLGVCLLASAYNGALFGPELPLPDFSPLLASFMQTALYLSGLLILLGLWSRPSTLLALLLFVLSIAEYGTYMLTYANYVGEMLVVLFLGGGLFAFESAKKISKRIESYAFLILRVTFGISVAFAAIYAKFIYSNLALETVMQYHLTTFFPFDPLFIVLGAGIIEVLIGLFFIIGFEIRHTALFFMFWIFLSLLYFGEAVWPHLVLVGVNIALFFWGYDRLTLQGRLFGTGRREPVL